MDITPQPNGDLFVQIDGRHSKDLGGTDIVNYSWTFAPAGGAPINQAGGPQQFQIGYFTLPAGIESFTVELVVEAESGLTSQPRVENFEIAE